MSRASAAAVAAIFAAILGLAGCEAPPLKVVFQLSGGPSQACPAAACGEVPMLCDAVLQVRILRPSEPRAPFISLCEPVLPDRNHDVCAIAGVDLPGRELPNELLEVQVMIWPRASVKVDPDTGELDCREINGEAAAVAFDLHGFPQEIEPAPALGGRAFYHPGDTQTVVTLGCTDLPSINAPACFGSAAAVTAELYDLQESDLVLSPSIADRLEVSVGEPRFDTGAGIHVLGPAEKRALTRVPNSSTWSGFLDDFTPRATVCVEAFDAFGGNQVAELQCGEIYPPGTRKFSLLGSWLNPAVLAQIRAAVGGDLSQGLTIGLVGGAVGEPLANVQVTADAAGGSVQYVSADYSSIVPGASATTDSGMFVSRDLPYGTHFTATLPGANPPQKDTGLGGRIAGKVTLLLLLPGISFP